MRFNYSNVDPAHSTFEQLPHLPLQLRLGYTALAVVGLVDSGATVNVLPNSIGQRLGAIWDDARATLRLAGNLGAFPAQPLLVEATVGQFAPVQLVFAWTSTDTTPLILGQMNFFLEFDICFYRSRGQLEINPKSV